MAAKVELFQYIRESYQAIGLDPSDSNATPIASNPRVVFIAFSIFQMCISTAAFSIYNAETIEERASSFYSSITNLYLLVNFLSLTTKMSDTSKVIEAFEKLIERSKTKILHFI